MKRTILLLALVFVSQWVTSAQIPEPKIQGYIAPDGTVVSLNSFAGDGPTTLIAKYLQMYASAPTCSRKGQMYYDTALNKQRVCTATPSTWETVASGAGVGTVTTVSVVSANGQSGSVANPTTTPAITLNNPTVLVATTSVQSPFFVTNAADPADGSAFRLGNNEFIAWEKFSPGTDWTLGINASDVLVSSAPFSIGAGSAITSTGAGGALGTNAFNSTAYAPLASPALTGTPIAPTAAVDTNTTQLATTAFVVGEAASANPVIDGTAAPGTSLRYARGDHVHPTDTSRAPLAGPTFTGTVTIPTGAQITKPNIIGTATNDNASAGSVGEYVSSSVALGNTALTTVTAANVTSISLTAGDWDVYGMCQFTSAATTTVTYLISQISTTSATVDGTDTTRGNAEFNALVTSNSNATSLPTTLKRVSLSGTTTVYLVAQASFGVSTLTVGGIIQARRVR